MAKVDRDWRDLQSETGLTLAGNLQPGWLVIGYYTVLDDSALHLADLSIVPGPGPAPEDPEHPVPWFYSPQLWLDRGAYLQYARDGNTIETTRPPRAVYSHLLRSVPLSEMQQEAEQRARGYVELSRRLKQWRGAPPHWTEYADIVGPAVDDNPSVAKLEYVEAAIKFAGSWETMSNREIARAIGISDEQLRDRLGSARKLKYLTTVGRGRRGGELTDLGQTLAARYRRKIAALRKERKERATRQPIRKGSTR